MALRIGGPAPPPMEEEEPPMEAPPEAPVAPEPAPDMGPVESGSVVEWLQEALDICKQAQCPEELGYALEQALTLLIGPAAMGATEPMEPETPDEDAAPDEEAEA